MPCSPTTQKKKVDDLGELPALDWSSASAKLLVTVVVVGVILLTTYSGWLDERVELGSFSLREWLNGLCVSVGAYFVIELLAKVYYVRRSWSVVVCHVCLRLCWLVFCVLCSCVVVVLDVLLVLLLS